MDTPCLILEYLTGRERMYRLVGLSLCFVQACMLELKCLTGCFFAFGVLQGVRKTRDPIDLSKKRIIEAGFATEKDLKAIEAKIRKDINDAVQLAKSAEAPDNLELYTDIYVDEIPKYIRGTELTNGHGSLL
mmetsp:Transcript_2118/g.4343  ORF Transcript_2118/g.4343 Transcript_2118/m.4343 type:complete len:132 (+) Transcript_2118:949-1344(+)